MKYQQGSLRKKTRKDGSQVWEFRYRDSAGTQKQKMLTCSDYPTLGAVKIALQTLVFTLNDPSTMTKTTPFGMVVERFIVEERLREIAAQPKGAVTEKGGLAYSTVMAYTSHLSRYILPRWAETPIESIRPMDVVEWLKGLPLAGMTKGLVKAIMHTLFEKAMLWEILSIQRNPMDLVKIKGTSVRAKKKFMPTAEQIQELVLILPEPYNRMVFTAAGTGLRASELTALRKEFFADSEMQVQASCVRGRIGPVKTEASGEPLPVDPRVLSVLDLEGEGLVFAKEDGSPYSAARIQQRVLRPLGKRLWGVDNLGWHSFRHSYRSFLDSEPVGVQQKLMRHANVSTTMNTYGASAMKAKREANSKVVQMLVGA